MAPVDRELLDQLEQTRARVREARDELLKRADAVAAERALLSKRLTAAQQALADARRILSTVESERVAKTQRARRATDDVLRLMSGLFFVAAFAALVGLVRHGPTSAPFAPVFPVVGVVAFVVARQLARRLDGSVDAGGGDGGG